MKRWLATIVLVLLLALGTALGWLVGTTQGARWLADQAQALEPRLSVRVVDGDLWSGVEVLQLGWEDEGISFSLRQALLRWRLSCLASLRVCVDHLEAEGLRLTLRNDPDQGVQTDEPMAPLELPLGISVSSLILSDSAVDLDGTRLALHRVQGAASLRGGTLDVRRLDIDGLMLALPEARAQEEPTGSQADPEPIVLPEVRLPLNLRMRDFSLREVELRQGEQRWPLESLQLAARLGRDGELALDALQLALPQGEAEASGRITLDGDYPLDLKLTLRGAEPIAGKIPALDAALRGSVAKLQARIDTRGPAVARVRAELEPLQPALPFQLRLSAEQLHWPPEQPQISLHQPDISARGTLEGYRFRGEAALEQARLGRAELSLAGAGDLQGLVLESLELLALEGELNARAELDWAEGLRWQGTLEAAELNPGSALPEWEGSLGGRVRLSGELAEQGLALNADIERFDGRLRDYPFALRGALRKTPEGPWQIRGLALDSGDNRLRLNGTVSEAALALRGELALNELSALLPGARGDLTGSLSAEGPLQTPNLDMDLRSGGLAYADTRVGPSRVHGRIAALGDKPSTLTWQLDALRLGEQALGRVEGALAGTRGSHRLDLSLAGGRFGGELALDGSLDLPRWRGTLARARVFAPEQRWELAAPVALAWSQEGGASVDAHCWSHRQARLCLRESLQLRPGSGAQLRLRLADYRLEWLRAWLPAELRAEGILNADLALDWEARETPRLAFNAASDEGQLVLRPLDEEAPLELPWQGLSVEAGLVDQRLRASLRLDSDTLGRGEAALRLALDAEPRTLEGEVDLSGLRLEPLRAVLPQLRRLEGRLSVSGSLAGNLNQPAFTGRVALRDGRVEAAALPMRPRDIELDLNVDGSRARIQGGFAAGDGQARLSGEADWTSPDWRVALALTGEGLAVADPPLYRLAVDPDLQLRAAPERLDLTGTLHVPRGEIVLDDLPPQAVSVSQDVVIVEGKPSVAPPESAQAEAGEAASAWEINSEVEISLGDAVSISGYGLSGRLEGSLRLRELTGVAPEAGGEIRIVEGRYEAYGQKLKIRRGQLIFAGPVSEPALNLEAVRETPEAVAGLRVSGQASDPLVSLFSEPPMPQEEILSYLIRGRGLGASGGAGGNLLAQAALSLGVYGGEGYATRLAETLGVQDFAVGTEGQGDDAQLVFSGAISPRLFLSYGVGVFKPENTLTLRYQLGRSVYLEAVSGLENALDIFYEFEF